MNKANYLISRTFKGAMAFVLAVGLCPVAPAMAQEGVAANEEGAPLLLWSMARVLPPMALWLVRLVASRARGPTACNLAAFPAMAMLRPMALVLVLLRRMLLKMTLRIPAFPLTLQKRLPWPTGKPMGPTMPPPRLIAGKFGAVASGWLTPKAA